MEGHILLNDVSASSVLDVGGARSQGYTCLMHAVVAETSISQSKLENTGFATPAAAEQMDESVEKNSRHPRWTKEETLVLMDAKKMQEEDARELVVAGRPFSANEKWEFVQSCCKLRGVDRDAQQCRKRWSNLYGEYKKVKDWQMQHRSENYWTLRRDERREAKLPGTFEFDIYAVLDSLISTRSGSTPELTCDTWRTNEDDEEVDCHAEYAGHAAVEPGSGDHHCFPAEGGFRDDQAGCVDEIYGRRKRRHVGDMTLVSVMESNGKALENALLKCAQAQIDAYNRNSELDRIQRKCIGDNLVGVLV
eukprot:c25639_g1_i2 orf=373-1293(+)